MAEQAAILLDGGFVKKRLRLRLGRFPTVSDVVDLCKQLMVHPRLAEAQLLRVFYYDAPPFKGKRKNPISNLRVDFGNTPAALQNRRLLDSLELQPDFAVRRGQLAVHGWKLGNAALKTIRHGNQQIAAKDLVPDLEQKGVDLRIGLDVASIALKRVVSILVLVTGDSDLIPAMKLARVEGLRVYLDVMGNPVHRELKAHADYVL